MRQASEKIRQLIEPAVAVLDYELVGIELLSQGRHSVLRIYIDSDKGITVDDCAAVSHQVSGVLDVEDPISGNYSLEVSSPGLDRPLFSLEQFARFSGQEVTIKLATPVDGRRKFTGRIEGLDENKIVLAVEGGEYLRLTLDEIDSARLVPQL